MSLQKYHRYTNKADWQKAVNRFLLSRNLPVKNQEDFQDKTISYIARGKIIAMWDMMDNEGWLMTPSYFHGLHDLFAEGKQ